MSPGISETQGGFFKRPAAGSDTVTAKATFRTIFGAGALFL
jgi:hypothetical protein